MSLTTRARGIDQVRACELDVTDTPADGKEDEHTTHVARGAKGAEEAGLQQPAVSATQPVVATRRLWRL